MCQLGDIIVVNKFKNEYGESIPKHSFVVINDEKDFIEGLQYDFVSNMLCSFHNHNQRRKKLKYEENLEIKEKIISGKKINHKKGYIKADQLYFFNKNLIKYQIIAHMEQELLEELLKLILALDKKGVLKNILSNLEKS